MATSKKILDDAVRARFMTMVREVLTNAGEEVLITNSNEICVPCVDSEGNEKYCVMTFKIPAGSRDGDAYDGYSVAESYEMKVKEKAEKAKAAAEKKASKKAHDEKMRKQKAEAKAKRENAE